MVFEEPVYQILVKKDTGTNSISIPSGTIKNTPYAGTFNFISRQVNSLG
jgi:hypothetical protein